MKSLIAVVCLIALASSTPADEPPRLNILWLIAEDSAIISVVVEPKRFQRPTLIDWLRRGSDIVVSTR